MKTSPALKKDEKKRGSGASQLLPIPEDPINIDLKIDVDIGIINQRYGIQPKEKLGDLIIDTQQRENLENIVGKHYKRTQMRDWEESLREVQRYYSFGHTAKVDMMYMREKYREIKQLVEEEEAKALKAQNDKGKITLKQELRLHLEEMAFNRGQKNQSVMLPETSRRKIGRAHV